MSYTYHGGHPADQHYPPWAMGAGYHPGAPYCGDQEEFHVGQGLSQRVYRADGTAGWATQTKDGKKIYPFNPKRFAAGKAKGKRFKNYTGEFRDGRGNVWFVPKQMPTHALTRNEHSDYQTHRHTVQQRKQGQQPQGQKNSKKKNKKQKKGKIDNYLIKLLDALKEKVAENKDKPFPSIGELGALGMTDILKEYSNFSTEFQSSQGELFRGRNPDQKWPKDLVEFLQISTVHDEGTVTGKYLKFFHIISNTKRGIAHVIRSASKYRASQKHLLDLAKALSKANGLDTADPSFEHVKGELLSKQAIALHSQDHIMAILPYMLVDLVKKGDTTQEILKIITKGSGMVDAETFKILMADNMKILKQVLKKVKRLRKNEGSDSGSEAGENVGGPVKPNLGTNGLVGMGRAF